MIILDNPKTEFRQHYGIKVDNLMITSVGEWRKGVAIGYSEFSYTPQLINKDRELLFRCYGGLENESIYRTSKGYYVVTEYRDCSAPGKDSDYRGPFLKCVISENGKEIIHAYEIKKKYGHFKNDWYDSDDKTVFTPREMGQGIVENENSFYRLDDFKKLFEVPKKFVIEGIFEQGFCLLSAPKDNRDFIVTVNKAKEIVDFFDVNNANELFKLIDKTNDSSLIKYCLNEESPTIRAFKKQQKQIEEQQEKEKAERLSTVNHYSANTFPQHYISDKSVTVEEFVNGITISEEELTKLKELHQMVCGEGKENGNKKYTFHLRKNLSSYGNCLECLFYSDFMILRLIGVNCGLNKLYRFYTLEGKCLSEKVFCNLQTTKNNTKIEEDKNFNNHIFHYSNGGKEGGIVMINDNVLIDNPFPDYMFNDKKGTYTGLTVNENFISFEGNYYDFFYNKIPTDYIAVEIEEVIKNYQHKLMPEFDSYMLASGSIRGNVICDYHAKEKYINGVIYLPIPRQFDAIESELHYKYKNRPNHIKEVIHIGDYEVADKGECSLYLFRCRPHGYCDTQGNVFYDFDPDKVFL